MYIIDIIIKTVSRRPLLPEIEVHPLPHQLTRQTDESMRFLAKFPVGRCDQQAQEECQLWEVKGVYRYFKVVEGGYIKVTLGTIQKVRIEVLVMQEGQFLHRTPHGKIEQEELAEGVYWNFE